MVASLSTSSTVAWLLIGVPIVDEQATAAGLDTSKAHVARVYDYWLGGPVLW